ncbi:unnamed protein product [Parascedosporium putredinis]|uniref:Uncharacterized protein n=1 Tax=Parascedosporium putredinis TaxID=1442378 RepID=A0A9P1HBA5_9PEZI|nr:unnamed protein product [Parascedosporium putredinis]CAI8003501.1 unnamed protein product [Parascedosporium putredinis]
MAVLRGYLVRLDPTGPNEAPAKLLQHTYENFWQSDDAREYFERYRCSLDTLASIERWATGSLGRGDSSTSIWEMNMALNYELFIEFSWFSRSKPSTARAKRALDLDPSNWDALLFLATDPEYHAIPPRETFDLLQKAKAQMDNLRSSDSSWLSEPGKRTVLASIMLEFGMALWRQTLFRRRPKGEKPAQDELEEAAIIHRQSLEFGDPKFHIMKRLFREYEREGCRGLWLQFISTLTDYSARWSPSISNLSKEVLVCHYQRREWPEENRFAKAADSTNQWGTVDAFFSACLAASESHGDARLQFEIRAHYAFTLFISSQPQKHSRGLGMLQELLDPANVNQVDDLDNHLMLDIQMTLAIYYLREALAENQKETTRLELGEKLASFVCNDRILRFSTAAQSRVHHIMMNALELLSDDIEENDLYAFRLLQDILSSLGDEENLRVAWFMWAASIWDSKRDEERKFVNNLENRKEETVPGEGEGSGEEEGPEEEAGSEEEEGSDEEVSLDAEEGLEGLKLHKRVQIMDLCLGHVERTPKALRTTILMLLP